LPEPANTPSLKEISMKTSIILGASILTAAALTACGNLSDDRFRRAIPSEKSVTVNAPEGNKSALTSADATAGEMSDYYKTTYKISRDVNNGIAAFLRLIKDITAQPATTRTDTTRTWGPGAQALDPAIYRLVMTEASADHFSYVLEARPKGTDDVDPNYLPLISGTADISTGISDGSGTLTLHLENWNLTDPTSCATGSLDAIYDTTVEPQFLTVAFNGFDPCDGTSDSKKPLQAASYYYARFADGSGNFQFVVVGDVHNGAIQPPVDETLAIRSRWDALGEGRSDVSITGGDLLSHDSIAAVTASECWDPTFGLTFAIISPVLIDPTHVVGVETSCAAGFQTAEYTSDL
jgi:hypothetical protein